MSPPGTDQSGLLASHTEIGNTCRQGSEHIPKRSEKTLDWARLQAQSRSRLSFGNCRVGTSVRSERRVKDENWPAILEFSLAKIFFLRRRDTGKRDGRDGSNGHKQCLIWKHFIPGRRPFRPCGPFCAMCLARPGACAVSCMRSLLRSRLPSGHLFPYRNAFAPRVTRCAQGGASTPRRSSCSP